ncbi:MAG: undecaprenyl-diphosphate phosphatase [Candidatus Aenigmatarchaeota archaeon]
MDMLQAAALGALQGATEWLPVSSSGHLVLLQSAFGVSPPVFFDLLLHMGTLAAVALYFRKDIAALARLTARADFKGEGRMVPHILLALLVSGAAGFLLKGTAEAMFSNAHSVGYAFLATGMLLLGTRFIGRNGQKTDLKPPILIGIAQGIAVIPGISRSGSTIAAGMMSGMEKKQAARFSFLLSIPAIIGATIMEWEPLALTPDAMAGAAFAFATGYLAIGTLLKIVKTGKFHWFSPYCFALGVLTLAFF